MNDDQPRRASLRLSPLHTMLLATALLSMPEPMPRRAVVEPRKPEEDPEHPDYPRCKPLPPEPPPYRGISCPPPEPEPAPPLPPADPRAVARTMAVEPHETRAQRRERRRREADRG